MYRMIFQYRWAAIVFVLLTVVGAVQLVGTEEEDGKLADAQRQVVEQREQFAATTNADPSEVEEEEEDADAGDEGFSDDSDLVQDAEGFDPSPEQDVEEEAPVKLVEPEETEVS